MIEWKNPKNILPENNKKVWVVYQHNKEHRYLSSEIMCGEVSYSNDGKSCRVESNDFTGKGSWSVYLTETDYNFEQGLAWCYIEELKLPGFIPHDRWWGEDDVS